MKRTHSKSSLFLMEIIINILFFSILFAVGLQLFVKAHVLSNRTTELHQAVTSVENAASKYQACSSSYTSLLQLCPTYDYKDTEITIYLDKAFQECRQSEAEYRIAITPSTGSFLEEMKPGQLVNTHFCCYDKDYNSLYEISLLTYSPRTPNSNSGGAVNE